LDARAYAKLGALLVALKRPAEAIGPLRRALALNPTAVSIQSDLGMALKDLGHLAEAESAFGKALELDPLCALAHHGMGDALRLEGRLNDARISYETALRLDSRLAPAHVALADMHLGQGEFQAAADRYREAITVDPGGAANYEMGLGVALMELRDGEGSLGAFARAVAGRPTSAEAHFNLASALLQFGRVGDAVGSVRQAIRLKENFPLAHALCGTALAALGDLEAGVSSLRKGLAPGTAETEIYSAMGARLRSLGHYETALDCYKRQLERTPEDATARHFAAALSGSNPDHADDRYVSEVFDAHAATFDSDLVKELGYTVPREILEELRGARPGTALWDVLDLGCGTGLVGVEIASHTRSLVGVDLSAKMLERAQGRKVYTQLRCADLMTALDAEASWGYDVVTAADVFVYVGRLDSVVASVRRALRPDGLFAFSVEAAEDALPVACESTQDGYRLGASGRYAHRAQYLCELARRNNFRVKVLRKTRTRFEHRRPVFGWLAVWMAETVAASPLR
jgi:predicted TPR repeat methyltransferase